MFPWLVQCGVNLTNVVVTEYHMDGNCKPSISTLVAFNKQDISMQYWLSVGSGRSSHARFAVEGIKPGRQSLTVLVVLLIGLHTELWLYNFNLWSWYGYGAPITVLSSGITRCLMMDMRQAETETAVIWYSGGSLLHLALDTKFWSQRNCDGTTLWESGWSQDHPVCSTVSSPNPSHSIRLY